jgi:hypothetical protein
LEALVFRLADDLDNGDQACLPVFGSIRGERSPLVCGRTGNPSHRLPPFSCSKHSRIVMPLGERCRLTNPRSVFFFERSPAGSRDHGDGLHRLYLFESAGVISSQRSITRRGTTSRLPIFIDGISPLLIA